MNQLDRRGFLSVLFGCACGSAITFSATDASAMPGMPPMNPDAAAGAGDAASGEEEPNGLVHNARYGHWRRVTRRTARRVWRRNRWYYY